MKKLLVSIFVFFLLIGTQNSFAHKPTWGATGHRAVGAIAQEYLTKTAEKKINQLLKGESLALVSTFGDDIKSDKRFKHLDPWHYINMPFDVKYEQSEKNPEGDIYKAIITCIDILKNKNSSEDDQVFHLKMLVHLMGDLHQPMHVGRVEDKGGNTIQLQWFKSGTNLHRVWDSNLIDHFDMTYTELAKNRKVVSKGQIKEWEKGTVADWLAETHQLTPKVYASVEVGQNLGYEYAYEHMNLVRSQLQKGGVRLAKVLNDIFV
jgi:hypothetical protein